MTKEVIRAFLSNENVVTENSDLARELFNQGRYGKITRDNCVQLSLIEAFYLMEKQRISVFDKRGKEIQAESYLRKSTRLEPDFSIRYAVFRDIRDRGYIIKTALKFGADFRIYDRGVKPGEDHARWIVYPVHEARHMTWYEFAAKNRVAHSTKKRLLIAVVDDEGDVSYWECRWLRP
ncbi:tRNA-intron lyase [Candidatus Woesearchaeota archaeon]|nr:tRNA-intron lyase [Candidatus Woesearchaeota archaeon]